MDCSLPGSSVLEILQAKILEWVAMPSSSGSSQLKDGTHISYSPALGFELSLLDKGQSCADVGEGGAPQAEETARLML